MLCAAALLGAASIVRADPPAGRGFRSYGGPQLEAVFPDTEGYRASIDRLASMNDRMEQTRAGFARAIQQVLAELTRPRPPRAPRPCAALAVPFARAQHLGQRYLDQGRELVRVFDLVTKLEEMGETTGLTPDYRARVRQIREAVGALHSDYREMKYAFHEQLVPEVTHVGCVPEDLLRLGAQAPKEPQSRAAPASAPAPTTIPPQVRPPKAEGPPPRAATMITFYVDNSHCGTPVRVYVDRVPVGAVPPRRTGGFRVRSGPHELCLLHDEPPARCGQPAAARKTYLHEGWSIQLRCAQ